MAGQLVDEIIIINFILSQTATLPRPHRKFAVMWDYLGSEPKYTLNLSNYQSAEILANFKDYQQVFIKLWFSSGGQYLTIYKYTAGSQNTAPAVAIKMNFSDVSAFVGGGFVRIKKYSKAPSYGELFHDTNGGEGNFLMKVVSVIGNDVIMDLDIPSEITFPVLTKSPNIDLTVDRKATLDFTNSTYPGGVITNTTDPAANGQQIYTGEVVSSDTTVNPAVATISVNFTNTITINDIPFGELVDANGNPTGINTPATQLADLDILEGTIILAGNTYADQLTMYNSASDNQRNELTGKYWILSAKQSDTIDNNLKTVRGIHIFMVADTTTNTSEYIDKPIFEYFAKYTQKDFYKQNSYTNSAIEGIALKTLQYLDANNLGALVFFPEFLANYYYNIGDTKGFTFNANMLRKDIESMVKELGFQQLVRDNTYNQDTISALEKVLADSAEYYKGLGFIGSYSTTSLPFRKQLESDILDKIIKGLELKYQVLLEAKKAEITITEQIGAVIDNQVQTQKATVAIGDTSSKPLTSQLTPAIQSPVASMPIPAAPQVVEKPKPNKPRRE